MNFERVARLDLRIRNESNTAYTSFLSITNLRMSFNIYKSEGWGTNTANIRIWNLSADHRNAIRSYGDEVTFYAGYARAPSDQILFIGDTTKVSHLFDFPDIVTSIECGDGERLLNYRIISVSFQERVPIRQVLASMASELDLTVAYFAPTPNIVYEQGFSYNGMAKNGIDKVVNALGLRWSIQNKNLVITEYQGSTGKPAIVINENTGLIGVPERFIYKEKDISTLKPKHGWRLSTVLKPEILAGDKVSLQSTKVDTRGIFTVEIARHEGDTHGPNWRSNFEVYAR